MNKKLKNFNYSMVCLLAGLVTTSTTLANATPKRAFDESANLYTEEKTDEALENVKQALKTYPHDIKLIKLKELLEQEKENEDQQQQEQQDQEQKEQDEKDQEDQQDKQDQDKQDEKDKEKPEDKEDKQDEQKEEQDKQDEQKPEDQEQQQQQPSSAEEMTPEEARMLLDSMRNEEKAQRDALRMIMGDPEPPQNGKDW